MKFGGSVIMATEQTPTTLNEAPSIGVFDLILFAALPIATLLISDLICRLDGHTEHFDSSLYYTLGLPVLALFAALAGALCPKYPWRWGLAIAFAQPFQPLLQQGCTPDPQSGIFAITGPACFGVVALVCILAAYIGAALRSSTKGGIT